MNPTHDIKVVCNKLPVFERPGKIEHIYEFPDNQAYEKWLKSEKNPSEWIYKSK